MIIGKDGDENSCTYFKILSHHLPGKNKENNVSFKEEFTGFRHLK
jgi:hypothetical protein